MFEDSVPRSSIILYQTEDGRTRIRCRFEDETLWLTQRLIADLFQVSVKTVNEHLINIYDAGELDAGTIRKFRIVHMEGARQVTREVEHYNLEAILAVGYRVRSTRGTQFRQWATARLSEYLVKGFTMDDERLKNPPGPGVRKEEEPAVVRKDRKSGLPVIQSRRAPPPSEELTPERVAKILMEQETEWAREFA